MLQTTLTNLKIREIGLRPRIGANPDACIAEAIQYAADNKVRVILHLSAEDYHIDHTGVVIGCTSNKVDVPDLVQRSMQ
jgi:hypothetical protein